MESSKKQPMTAELDQFDCSMRDGKVISKPVPHLREVRVDEWGTVTDVRPYWTPRKFLYWLITGMCLGLIFIALRG